MREDKTLVSTDSSDCYSEPTINEKAKIAEFQTEIAEFKNYINNFNQWTIPERFMVGGSLAGLVGQFLGLGLFLPENFSDLFSWDRAAGLFGIYALASFSGALGFVATGYLAILWLRSKKSDLEKNIEAVDSLKGAWPENERGLPELKTKELGYLLGKATTSFFIFNILSLMLELFLDDTLDLQAKEARLLATFAGNTAVAGIVVTYFSLFSKLFNMEGMTAPYIAQVFLSLFAMPYGAQVAEWLINQESIDNKTLEKIINGVVPGVVSGILPLAVPVATAVWNKACSLFGWTSQSQAQPQPQPQPDVEAINGEDDFICWEGSSA